jgi:hypothetical protein
MQINKIDLNNMPPKQNKSTIVIRNVREMQAWIGEKDAIASGTTKLQSYKVPSALMLNILLYYISDRKLKYGGLILFEPQAFRDVNFSHFTQVNINGKRYKDHLHISYGCTFKGVNSFGEATSLASIITLTPDIWSMALYYVHTGYNAIVKAAANRNLKPAIYSESAWNKMLLEDPLDENALLRQRKIARKNVLEQVELEYPKEDISLSEDSSSLEFSMEKPEDDGIPTYNAPRSKIPMNETLDESIDVNNSNQSLLIPSTIAPITDDRTISEILDDDDVIRDYINQHEVLKEVVKGNTTLRVVGQKNNNNDDVVDLLPAKVLVEAEKEVVKECLKEIIMDKSNNMSIKEIADSYALETSSFIKQVAAVENRLRITLPRKYKHRTIANFPTIDTRMLLPELQMKHPRSRSWKYQDDDYIDYAFYGFIREAGTIVKDIMTLPLGFEYNSERRGSNVVIKGIHFRNTFTHVTGTKVQGRMIVAFSEFEQSGLNMFNNRVFNDLETHEILQKSVTMYAGDIEELDAVDIFYNPTIMSQYDFKNVILGRRWKILYDYYADLNTEAVKGVVGEDIESVDSQKTKWVKLEDLELPLFYDSDDKVPTRGSLIVLFMGDYFGGEIQTNMTMRVYYNSN